MRDYTRKLTQWFPTLTVHWNYMERFKKYCCLGHTVWHSDIIGFGVHTRYQNILKLLGDSNAKSSLQNICLRIMSLTQDVQILTLKPVNMLPYKAKRALQMWLSKGSWNEIILDTIGGSKVIIYVLTRGEGRKIVKNNWRYYEADFENGWWGHEPKNVGSL